MNITPIISQAAGALSGGLSSALSSASSMLTGVGGGGATQSTYITSPRGRPEYALIITQEAAAGRPRMQVRAELPADFQFDLTAEWAAPFAEGIIHSDRINMLAQMMGLKFSNQAFSSNFWTGSSDVNFTFPIVFVTETGYADLLQPIMSLVQMATPSIDPTTGFFRAPGPILKAASALHNALGDAAQTTKNFIAGGASNIGSLLSGGTSQAPQTNTAQDAGTPLPVAIVNKIKNAMKFEGKISLQIGNFMFIPSVVITNINQDFKVLMGPDGVPLMVTCSVSFKTHQTPSAEDIINWYYLGPSLAPPAVTTTGNSSLNVPGIAPH